MHGRVRSGKTRMAYNCGVFRIKLTTKIARRQLRYYGHVARMESGRLVKRISD